MCQRQGTPRSLAGSLFRFLISSLVFFFPSQPGTSCRGNDNMWGKTTEINNISSHRLTPQTPSPISPFIHQKLVFFVVVHVAFFNLQAHLSICISTRFILRVVTFDPWNWYVTLSCTNLRGSHTLADLFFPSLSFFRPCFFSCTRNPSHVLQRQTHSDSQTFGNEPAKTPPNLKCWSFLAQHNKWFV